MSEAELKIRLEAVTQMVWQLYYDSLLSPDRETHKGIGIVLDNLNELIKDRWGTP